MEYGIDKWAEWPYGAHEPDQARRIRELLELADSHEDAKRPESAFHEGRHLSRRA